VSTACQSALSWGGYLNGLIPTSAMTPIGDGHTLQADASRAFLAMREAAQAEGVDIPLTDSYRSLAAQVELRQRKGNVVATATPGTSVHGWGRAIDINLLANPAVRPWLAANSERFGWVNPAWARRPGKSFEPWHYEFYGSLPGVPGCNKHDHGDHDEAPEIETPTFLPVVAPPEEPLPVTAMSTSRPDVAVAEPVSAVLATRPPRRPTDPGNQGMLLLAGLCMVTIAVRSVSFRLKAAMRRAR
jgi:hypothetical protein